MSLSSGELDTILRQGELDVVQYYDGKLNTAIELALLHGIYTGIVSVALWNIFNNKFRSIGRVMVASIIFLYVATTINFSLNSKFRHDVTIGFHIIYLLSGIDKIHLDSEYVVVPEGGGVNEILGIGIRAVMSTVIADSVMIWRYWMVWGRR
ncbi:hypothetical protein ARMGADRAFT_482225 [Armillaria gallica]|uniref:Uncharacterized protein n=1 Tax=Armillaria gallica TaxID=47427 RepID=A0A2H3DYB6_ARMGA|nr:hypothetical protein ARMGADRAFT_482225 [Armillaria gallica]